jgi:hypothetical protein
MPTTMKRHPIGLPVAAVLSNSTIMITAPASQSGPPTFDFWSSRSLVTSSS